eukprot:210396_1
MRCQQPTYAETKPSSLSMMVDYIHDKNKPIPIRFDHIIDFDTFKDTILTQLKITQTKAIKIGIEGTDNKMRMITAKNFKTMLQAINISSPYGSMTTLFIGFDSLPTPLIDSIYFHILDCKFNIKIRSPFIYMNTFCIEVESKQVFGQDVIKLDSVVTTNFNAIINNIDPNYKYRVRIKATNIFGNSEWSTWTSVYITAQDLISSNEQEKCVYIATPGEKLKILMKTLFLFNTRCDFSDTSDDNKELIAEKKNILKEILECVSQDTWFEERLLKTYLETIFVHLFRYLPYRRRILPISMVGTKVDEVADIDDKSFTYSSWKHLKIIYEILLKVINTKQFTSDLMDKYLTVRMLTNLIELFASDDTKERDYLMLILHNIYAKCVPHRLIILEIVNNYFYRMMYSNEFQHVNGINELLLVICSIITDLKCVAKSPWPSFMRNVLVPLHKSPGLKHFKVQLTQCCVNYAVQDAKSGMVILGGLLKFWPTQSTEKEEIFIVEVVSIINSLITHVYYKDELAYKEYKSILVCVCKKLTECMVSMKTLIAYKATMAWKQKCMQALVNCDRKSFLPKLCTAFYRNKKRNIHIEIRNMGLYDLSSSVEKIYKAMDSRYWKKMNKYLSKKDKKEILRNQDIENAQMKNEDPYEIVRLTYIRHKMKYRHKNKKLQLTEAEKMTQRNYKWGKMVAIATIIENDQYNIHYYVACLIVSFL